MSDTMPPAATHGAAAGDEFGTAFLPRFGADRLIPCIAVDAESGEVVMFAYMNRESLDLTIGTGTAHYWSRSRQAIWKKGETSGNVQSVVEMRTDCDQDVILLRVRTAGDGVNCHTGQRSCFYRRVEPGGGPGAEVRLAFVGDGGPPAAK